MENNVASCSGEPVLELHTEDTDFETESGNEEREEDEEVYDLEGSTRRLVQKEMLPVMEELKKIQSHLGIDGKGKGKGKRSIEMSSESDEEDIVLEGKKRRKVEDDDEGLFEGEEEYGDGLDEETVSFLEKRTNKAMKGKKLAEIAEKFKVPQNAKFLKAPKTNIEIFRQLKSAQSRRKEKQLQTMQDNMAKATIGFARIMDCIVDKGAKQTMKDSLTLLSQATRQVSFLRREKHRFSLPMEMRGVCDLDTPIEDGLLYGNNVKKIIKESEEKSRAMKSKNARERRPFLEFQNNQGPKKQKFSYQQRNQNQHQQKQQLRSRPGNFFQKSYKH